MKYCPQCQTAYTDDTLKFCLQDGTSLTEAPGARFDMPTVALDDSATLVSRKPPQQVVRIDVPKIEEQNWQPTEAPPQIRQPTEQPQFSQPPVETKKSNTASIVLATILGMTVVFGIIGAGAWFLLQSRKTPAVANVNNAPVINRPANANTPNAQNTNANTASPTSSPSPTMTPIPKPTLKPEELKAVTNGVEDSIGEWENSSENLDIDRNLNQYAETVNYYGAGKTNRARVRADKMRAFEQYDSIDFNISNVKITPDASGEKATAVFDKEWQFEGEEKFSAGKVQSQLTFAKIGGQWLITGEKDLKTYYVQK